jgi:hypothetical protein
MRAILSLCLFFATSIAEADIQVLKSGSLYHDDAGAFGDLDGTEWYSITSSPTKIKKIKLKATAESSDSDSGDSSDSISHSLNISGEEKAMFFVRGLTLKEGIIKDSQNNPAIADTESPLSGGACSIYYKSKKTSSQSYPDNGKAETRELFVKCKGKSYSISKYVLEATDVRPSISWAGDLNGDGLPEFEIQFDPWEKSAPNTIYFSEKIKDGYRYIEARLQYQGC